MARVYCNGRLLDAYSKEYQAYIVDIHAYNTQHTHGRCGEAGDYTAEGTYGTDEVWLIKK